MEWLELVEKQPDRTVHKFGERAVSVTNSGRLQIFHPTPRMKDAAAFLGEREALASAGRLIMGSVDRKA